MCLLLFEIIVTRTTVPPSAPGTTPGGRGHLRSTAPIVRNAKVCPCGRRSRSSGRSSGSVAWSPSTSRGRPRSQVRDARPGRGALQVRARTRTRSSCSCRGGSGPGGASRRTPSRCSTSSPTAGREPVPGERRRGHPVLRDDARPGRRHPGAARPGVRAARDVEADRELGIAIARHIAERLQTFTEQMTDLGSLPVTRRVAKFLLASQQAGSDLVVVPCARRSWPAARGRAAVGEPGAGRDRGARHRRAGRARRLPPAGPSGVVALARGEPAPGPGSRARGVVGSSRARDA